LSSGRQETFDWIKAIPVPDLAIREAKDLLLLAK